MRRLRTIIRTTEGSRRGDWKASRVDARLTGVADVASLTHRRPGCTKEKASEGVVSMSAVSRVVDDGVGVWRILRVFTRWRTA